MHLERRVHQKEVGEDFGAEGAHEERCLNWPRAECVCVGGTVVGEEAGGVSVRL